LLLATILSYVTTIYSPHAFVVRAFDLLVDDSRSYLSMPRPRTNDVLSYNALCVISIPDAQWQLAPPSTMLYLTLPLDLPALLAIFFSFFCHSGLVNGRTHRLTRRANRRSFASPLANRRRAPKQVHARDFEGHTTP
jgi:hypothetical protein